MPAASAAKSSPPIPLNKDKAAISVIFHRRTFRALLGTLVSAFIRPLYLAR
jgi:hypothetical protein